MWAKLPARIRAEWENQKGQICFSCNVSLLPLSGKSLSKSVCVVMQSDQCFFSLTECEQVTAKTVENDSPEKVPKVTTVNPVPFSDKEVSVSSFSAAIAG